MAICSLALFLLNLPFTVLAYSTAGKQTTTTQITRAQFLSFTRIPDSFMFPAVTSSAAGGNVFSDSTKTLPAARIIKVNDTRMTGGFTLQVSATNFISPSNNTIPAGSLRFATTATLAVSPRGTIKNNLIYLSGFNGDMNVIAPLSSTLGPSCSDFGQVATFTDPACQTSPTANDGGNTVDILRGTLPFNQGRSGEMAVGISYNLHLPAYTVPDTYTSVLTFTLIDSTT